MLGSKKKASFLITFTVGFTKRDFYGQGIEGIYYDSDLEAFFGVGLFLFRDFPYFRINKFWVYFICLFYVFYQTVFLF